MASKSDEDEGGNASDSSNPPQKPTSKADTTSDETEESQAGPRTPPKSRNDEEEVGKGGDSTDDDDEEEEEEDEEPRLKYAALTKGQADIYRNGDAVSAFLVAGDKMMIGTHNGHIHVLQLPSFKSLRAYRANTASITSISVSPYPSLQPPSKPESPSHQSTEQLDAQKPASPIKPPGKAGKPGKQLQQLPNIPSNNIHIATSSIDGNVCVFSLMEPTDVIKRNFGRPVQSVALSPNFRTDRSYLSGGLAGTLVWTVGGKIGSSANANTSGAAAAAAGWLNTIGIGGSQGVDNVLHSNEGSISTIKWSLSGKYVVWVNEKGIKLMRSNISLESHESEYAWRRINHIDHPNQDNWEEMSGIWKARAEWINEKGLESDEDEFRTSVGSSVGTIKTAQSNVTSSSQSIASRRRERLVVGWGSSIWIVDVQPHYGPAAKDHKGSKIAKVEVVSLLRTDDCIVSGVTLFTPTLLVLLAYVIPEEGKEQTKSDGTPRRGITRRQNALQPEMRIIDINTNEEVCVADTLTMSRFESLSATDYHLGVLPVIRSAGGPNARGALDVIGELGGTIGGSIWDATVYSAKLFSSAASVMSTGSASDKASGSNITPGISKNMAALGQEPHAALLTRGMKIFIQSPYDCVLATKPTMTDHIAWLEQHNQYEEAWTALQQHPEAAQGLPGTGTSSVVGTPRKADASSTFAAQGQSSLAEFFADDASQKTAPGERSLNSLAEKEKRRIGEKWLQQLVNNAEWEKAGKTCAQVLNTTAGWDHWIFAFIEAEKFDEIVLFIPTATMQPPISGTAYEIILGHYISNDRLKLAELLERWPNDLFNPSSVISAIESRLKFGDIREDSEEGGKVGRDWRILTSALAKLYIADGRPRDALRCLVQLRDADAAMKLISQYHLIDAVAEDIPGIIQLRVPKEKQSQASFSDLEEASDEAIKLLVTEAHHGTVMPETVVKQLGQKKGMQPYQFFYLRSLWNGDSMEGKEKPVQRRLRRDAATSHYIVEGRSLVNDCADIALKLFAEYDRELLFEFLKTSQSYTLSLATSICEKNDYIPELIYLLAKEGQTKKALHVIMDKLEDFSQAIAFAKEQDDQDLWNDLLNYSMKKPAFIRALLEEVGTAIDPITLIKRIPESLEITGLREALIRMLREYELQETINEGAARVFRSEVSKNLEALISGRKQGIRFEVRGRSKSDGQNPSESESPQKSSSLEKGCCGACHKSIAKESSGPLVAFPCLHSFHLACFLNFQPESQESSDEHEPRSPQTFDQPELTSFPSLEESHMTENSDNFESNLDYGIGPKVRFAKQLRDRGSLTQGCPLETTNS